MSDEVTAAYRAHWARAVAVLCRWTGDVELAEDAVRDAAEQTLRTWPPRRGPRAPGRLADHHRPAARPTGSAATGAGPSGPSCWPGWRRSTARPTSTRVGQRAAAVMTS